MTYFDTIEFINQNDDDDDGNVDAFKNEGDVDTEEELFWFLVFINVCSIDNLASKLLSKAKILFRKVFPLVRVNKNWCFWSNCFEQSWVNVLCC